MSHFSHQIYLLVKKRVTINLLSKRKEADYLMKKETSNRSLKRFISVSSFTILLYLIVSFRYHVKLKIKVGTL